MHRNFVARHCENGIYHIQGIGFDQSYSPVAHADSFRFNIAIVDMHRINARILDIIKAFQNTNVSINEILCVSPPPYYLDCSEKYYPNDNLNIDDGQFFIQLVNGIKEIKPDEKK